jgi:hypothetical protein
MGSILAGREFDDWGMTAVATFGQTVLAQSASKLRTHT